MAFIIYNFFQAKFYTYDRASIFVLTYMQRCHLHSLSKGDGAITAQHRNSPSEDTGFTFLGCKITGVGTAILGRPWGPYSRVVFALTYMSSVIVPQGWDDWGDQSKRRCTHKSMIYIFTKKKEFQIKGFYQMSLTHKFLYSIRVCQKTNSN